MREGTKYRRHNEQDKYNDADQISKEDGGIAAASQRSIGDPNCDKRVGGSECVIDGGILVLYQKTLT